MPRGRPQGAAATSKGAKFSAGRCLHSRRSRLLLLKRPNRRHPRRGGTAFRSHQRHPAASSIIFVHPRPPRLSTIGTSFPSDAAVVVSACFGEGVRAGEGRAGLFCAKAEWIALAVVGTVVVNEKRKAMRGER
jgi:hypothetical protein